MRQAKDFLTEVWNLQKEGKELDKYFNRIGNAPPSEADLVETVTRIEKLRKVVKRMKELNIEAMQINGLRLNAGFSDSLKEFLDEKVFELDKELKRLEARYN